MLPGFCIVSEEEDNLLLATSVRASTVNGRSYLYADGQLIASYNTPDGAQRQLRHFIRWASEADGVCRLQRHMDGTLVCLANVYDLTKYRIKE